MTDSHVELPRTDAEPELLGNTDFEAFRRLNDLPIGMTAHVLYEKIDPDQCATLSPKLIEIIREDIGFDGLLLTDDLSMSALSGSFSERTVRALSAGCDVALHCNGDPDEMQQIAGVAGEMTAAAARRARQALLQRSPRREIDPAPLLAELDELLMLGGDE